FEGPAAVPDEEMLMMLEEFVGKKVRPVVKGEEEGLLVALYDKEGRFLGIGIVVCVDDGRRAAKIYTPADEEAVAKICVGRIRIDRDGNEIEGAGPQLEAPPEAMSAR
ncbi:hypothetical protein DRO33_05445, partial [Candidatus Bathyarchaeota archaeon]